MEKFPLKRALGFTLIELMVVIAIIGILMAAGIVAFTQAQKSSRDARRRADADAIAKALEQYYQDNSFNYPNAQSGAQSTNGSWLTRAPASYFGNGVLPLDPLNGATYNYKFRGGDKAVSSPIATRFCVAVTLEIANGNCTAVTNPANDNNYTDPLFAQCVFTTPGTGTMYCVQHTQ